jgi:23S rRNA (cytosine1962-C5)-methyltransferase
MPARRAHPSIRLKPGREKSLQRRHPWIFAGAVDVVQGEPEDGETVEVLDAHGQFLGWGAISPASQIRVRIWSWDHTETIGADFFNKRLRNAIAVRQSLHLESQTNAYRLVHAESDGLPGLVADRYGDYISVQILSSGAERWRDTLVDQLADLTGVTNVYERSDVDVRKLENLPERVGPLRGDAPTGPIVIHENGLKFWVNIAQGHKTGYYLDQRDNRLWARRLAPGRSVLDCFSYSGGFLVNAAAGGASTISAVDSSGEALQLARQNLEMNGMSSAPVEWIEGDVFHILRGFRDRARKFDLIILDPPKFAPTSAHAEQAARGYKDINLLAFKLLKPAGFLLTFSCSGGIDADLFQKIIAGAALDAGVHARVLERLFQGPDHPVALNFPEGAYLKGLVVTVD